LPGMRHCNGCWCVPTSLANNILSFSPSFFGNSLSPLLFFPPLNRKVLFFVPFFPRLRSHLFANRMEFLNFLRTSTFPMRIFFPCFVGLPHSFSLQHFFFPGQMPWFFPSFLWKKRDHPLPSFSRWSWHHLSRSSSFGVGSLCPPPLYLPPPFFNMSTLQ